MFESFVVTEPNPNVLEIKKTKLTRALLICLFIFVLICVLALVFVGKPTWPQMKALMYVVGSLNPDKLKQLLPRYQTLLALFVALIVLLSTLFWAVKNLFAEHKFTFNSKNKNIEKNGHLVAKFDDIKIVGIKSIWAQALTYYKLSLYFKEQGGLFSHKKTIGRILKQDEAFKTAIKIAEYIGVDAIEIKFISDKVLNPK